MHRQGYSNRAAARSAVRNATVRRSLARGRVPGNVAGVERRGDGERQGLEIKKCKFARVFMATISLMVVCCEIFRIEENWGKRRGEGTPPYGWGRVRCRLLMQRIVFACDEVEVILKCKHQKGGRRGSRLPSFFVKRNCRKQGDVL